MSARRDRLVAARGRRWVRPGEGRQVDDATQLRAVAALSAVGGPAAHADLDPAGQRAVGLARALGAPLAPVLGALAARHEDETAATRAVRRATAQGRAVALVLGLTPPVLAPLLLRLTAPAGAGPPPPAVLAAAAALWLLGVGLVATMVRRASRAAVARPRAAPWVVLSGVAAVLGMVPLALALLVPAVLALRRPAPPDPALADLVELTSVGVRAGLGLGPALRVAGRRLPPLADAAALLALWLELGARGAAPALPGLAARLAPAHQHGAPLLPVLDDTHRELRAAELQRRLEAAERLGVQLTVPTALLLLPAALLVVLAPVVRVALAPLR